jgi:methyl-accepting chemotaxis protein
MNSIIKTFISTSIIWICLHKPALAQDTLNPLLEPLFAVFRSDQTALIISISLFVFSFALIFDFRRKIYRPLERDIDEASGAFANATDPESFASEYETVNELLGESRFLAPIWSEYRETITRAKSVNGVDVIQNTKRPKDYFTADAISKQRGSMSSLDNWPNTFVGIGLLVTFLGLTVAVYDTASAIKAASSNVGEVLKALEDLLTVASIKFLTSVSGIGCSILMNLSVKSMQSNINQKLNRLHDRIERCLEFLSLERLQKDTIDAIHGISGSIASGVAEGIQGIAGNELRDFAGEMTKVTSALASSKNHIEGFGEMYLKQISQIDEGFKSRLETINLAMDQWIEKLQQDFDKTSQVIASQVNLFTAQVERIQSSAETISQSAQVEIKQNIETVTASFENASETFSKQINEQSKVTQENLSSIRELIKAVENNADEFTVASQKTISSINNVQDIFQTSVMKLSQSITGIDEQISSYTEKLEKISTTLREANEEKANQAKFNQENISNLTTDISRVIADLQAVIAKDKEGIVEAFKPLANEVQNLTSKLVEIGQSETKSENIISRLFKS